jgi:hypothetical protein
MIPSLVVVLGNHSFSKCESLESVAFERGCRLEQIEEFAFWGRGLKSIEIPSTVRVLGKKSFSSCRSLESVTFENGSQLERIDESVFAPSPVDLHLVSSRFAMSKRCREKEEVH